MSPTMLGNEGYHQNFRQTRGDMGCDELEIDEECAKCASYGLLTFLHDCGGCIARD